MVLDKLDRQFLAISAGLLMMAGLSGCAGAVIGAGATAGISVAQERSVGDAIDDTTIATNAGSPVFARHSVSFVRNKQGHAGTSSGKAANQLP